MVAAMGVLGGRVIGEGGVEVIVWVGSWEMR